MKEGTYTFLESEQLNEYRKRHEYHKTLHSKMREFIMEKGLEKEFYEEYFPEADSLMKDWIESIKYSRKLLDLE